MVAAERRNDGAPRRWSTHTFALSYLLGRIMAEQPRPAAEQARGGQRWAVPRLKTPPSSPGEGVVRLSPVWTPDQSVDEHGALDRDKRRGQNAIGSSSPPSALESLLRPANAGDKELRWRRLDTLVEDDDETVGAGEAVGDVGLRAVAQTDAERWDHALRASRSLHQRVAAQLAASTARREHRQAAPLAEPEPEPEPTPAWVTGVARSWLGNFWTGIPWVATPLGWSNGPTADSRALPWRSDPDGSDPSSDTEVAQRDIVHVSLMENLEQHDEAAAACRMLLAATHADWRGLRRTFDAWAAHAQWVSWTEDAVARFVWESEGETVVWAWKRWMRYFEKALRFHISVGRIVSSSGYGAVSWTWSTWRAWLRALKRRRVVLDKIVRRHCRCLKATVLTRWRAYAAEVQHVQRISCRAVHRLMDVRQHAALVRWRQRTMEQAHAREIYSRVLRRLAHRKLAASFATWECWKRGRAEVVERAMLRWRSTSLTRAWVTWLGTTQEGIRLRLLVINVLRKLAHLQLHSSFAQWMDLCTTTRRRKALVDRCLSRMKMATLRCAYRWWRERSVDVRRVRRTFVQAVARMRTVALATALDGWVTQVSEQRRICGVAKRVVARLRSRVLYETLRRWANAVEDVRARRLAEVHTQAVAEHAKQVARQADREESEDELPSQSYHYDQDQNQRFATQSISRLQWEQEKALLVLRSLAAEMRRVELQEAQDEDAQQQVALAKALAARQHRSKTLEEHVHQAHRPVPVQPAHPALARRSVATLQHWAARGSQHGKTHTQPRQSSSSFATDVPYQRREYRQPSKAAGRLAGRSVGALENWARAVGGRNNSAERRL